MKKRILKILVLTLMVACGGFLLGRFENIILELFDGLLTAIAFLYLGYISFKPEE